MEPTVEMLRKLLETMGFGLRLEGELDYATSVVGLFDSIFEDLEQQTEGDVLRKTAEFVGRFRSADGDRKRRMIAVEPESTMDDRWDAFAAALVEWLSVSAEVETPKWTYGPNRYLDRAWWVTAKKSLRAWEYAGTPAAFQEHGVYIHRDSLANV